MVHKANLWRFTNKRGKGIHRIGIHYGTLSRVYPMLAEEMRNDSLLDDSNWAGEYKFDGTRALISKKGDTIQMINRLGIDYTERFPDITEQASRIKGDFIIDGELVYFNPKTKRDLFTPCQRRASTHNPKKLIMIDDEAKNIYNVKGKLGEWKPIIEVFPIDFMVFDILERDGDLRKRKYLERKRILRKEIPDSENIKKVREQIKGKRKWFAKLFGEGREGLILKEINSPYQEGIRSWYWQKAKTKRDVEVVVVGYTKGTGIREGSFGALVLGSYKNGKLVYIGKAGSGFTDRELTEWRDRLDKEKTVKTPFDYKTTIDIGAEKFVEPKHIVTVEYFERTPKGIIRFPVYKKYRMDKSLRDVKYA